MNGYSANASQYDATTCRDSWADGCGQSMAKKPQDSLKFIQGIRDSLNTRASIFQLHYGVKSPRKAKQDVVDCLWHFNRSMLSAIIVSVICHLPGFRSISPSTVPAPLLFSSSSGHVGITDEQIPNCLAVGGFRLANDAIAGCGRAIRRGQECSTRNASILPRQCCSRELQRVINQLSLFLSTA
jgi:hypothetical protein